MSDIDTIFALSSGAGRAGVAVIRVSGPSTRAIVEDLIGSVPPPRQATLRTLRDPVDGGIIDRGLVLVFAAPASFTGEDVAEFHLHGGRAVLRRMLTILGDWPGCRSALAGEFTRRALLNGKMDLPSVEGLADLLAADTEAQRRQAIRQLDGALGAQCKRWRAQLIDGMALVEAMIDFGEEDDVAAAATLAAAWDHAERVKDEIDRALADSPRAERLREGFTVVIAGPPNSGKSTLLNAIARRDVAIVSAEAGTTRDLLEVSLDLDGLPVTLIDTAGLRDAVDPIEAEGIARALRRAAAADLVLWLTPAADIQEPPALPWTIWRIITKIDSSSERPIDMDGAISAHSGEGLSSLLTRIRAAAADGLEGDEPLVMQQRHRQCLTRAAIALRDVLGLSDPELVAEELRVAAQALAELIGIVHVEDVLDAVFSQFCIGK